MSRAAIIGSVAFLLVMGLGTWGSFVYNVHFVGAIVMGLGNLMLPVFLQRTKARTNAVRLEPAPGELLVTASYYHGDALSLGADEGLLTLVDGWIFFQGDRTSWSVRPSDLDRIDSHLLSYPGPRGVFRVALSYQPVSSVFWRSDHSLSELLDRWKEGPEPEGEAVLPPVVWGDPPRGERRSLMVLAFFAVVTVVAASLLFGIFVSWVAGLIIALPSGVAVGMAVVLQMRHTRATKEAHLALAEGPPTLVDRRMDDEGESSSESSVPDRERPLGERVL